MARVLLDTDVIIDHIAGVRRLSLVGHDAAYSIVTRAELFSGRDADEELIGRILTALEEIALTRPIAERAGRIRRTARVKLPDAIIAATAILSRRRLATGNVRDFQRVPGLRLHTGT